MKFLHKKLGEITIMMEAEVEGKKYSMISSTKTFSMIHSRYGFGWHPEFRDPSRKKRNGTIRSTREIYVLWGNADDLNARGITKLGRSNNKTLGKKFMKIVESSKYMEFTKRKDHAK
jgi:hypothetical protein